MPRPPPAASLLRWRPPSLDRQPIHWSAYGAGERQRRADEQKLIDTVARAILREAVQVEDLAKQQSHLDDRNSVHGQVNCGAVHTVTDHPDRPVVARKRSDPLFVQPRQSGQANSGLGVMSKPAPPALGTEVAEIAGAQKQRIARR